MPKSTVIRLLALGLAVVRAQEDPGIIPDVVYSHGDKELSVTYIVDDGEERVVKDGDVLTIVVKR